MSLNATTLSGAVTADQTKINLASGTGAAVGKFLRTDSEVMLVQGIDNSPLLDVARGQRGTSAVAHATGARAVLGLGSDFPVIPEPRTYSYGAAGALTVAPGVAILKSGAASAMTLRDPLANEEGLEITIIAADAQAYTVSNAAGSGFNGGGAGGDVGTFGGAIGDNFVIRVTNGIWDVVTSKNVTLG